MGDLEHDCGQYRRSALLSAVERFVDVYPLGFFHKCHSAAQLAELHRHDAR
ncbi:hypothetical protein B0H14DRAFT_3431195 [Mycena olivaceomarginata]|nr:hypothetical protein B0H14DRAFT_3431195 [Mycena olivaceomarginata]